VIVDFCPAPPRVWDAGLDDENGGWQHESDLDDDGGDPPFDHPDDTAAHDSPEAPPQVLYTRREHLQQLKEAKRRRLDAAKDLRTHTAAAMDAMVRGLPAQQDRPAPAPARRWSTRLVAPGHQWAAISSTHELWLAADTWVFCGVCGHYSAGSATKALTKSCPGTRPKGSDGLLKKLRAGCHPLEPWPAWAAPARRAAAPSNAARPAKRARLH